MAKPNTLANASNISLVEAYIAIDIASVSVVCADEALWNRVQREKVRLRREMDRRGMSIPYAAIGEASHDARRIVYRTALDAAA